MTGPATVAYRARWLVLLLAALAFVLALLLPAPAVSASVSPATGTRVGAISRATSHAVGVHACITAGQRPVRGPSQLQVVVGNCVAAEAGGAAERTVVMGRNMGGRVIPYAEKNGFDFYKGTPSWVPRGLQRFAPKTLNRIDMAFNKRWINNEIGNGSRIIDIGEPPGMPPSDFYDMELNQVDGYWNYFQDIQP